MIIQRGDKVWITRPTAGGPVKQPAIYVGIIDGFLTIDVFPTDGGQPERLVFQMPIEEPLDIERREA
jgi:hypothetical protein